MQIKYNHTKKSDDLIRKAYSITDNKIERRKLLEEVMVVLNSCSRNTIYRRAIELGLSKPTRKFPRWSPAEDEILLKYSHLSLDVIIDKLKDKGFIRTQSGIIGRIHELFGFGGSKNAREDKGIYSATSLANLLGVSHNAIKRTIKYKQLKASRVSEKDDWEIKIKDIKTFIKEYPLKINKEKCNLVWIIDVLS